MQLTPSFPGYLLPLLEIEQFNALQLDTIEKSKDHRNLILLAATGSGKTIGYLVPLLSKLKIEDKHTQAVIIVPVRELADQIAAVFKKMKTGYKLTVCYGGHSRETEIHNLKEQPEVLIGTPGRLCDHIRNGFVHLSKATTLVLDEFDKSLEMGFEEEISFIVNALTHVETRILVSATDLEVLPEFIHQHTFHKINYLPEGFNAPIQLNIQYISCNDRDKAEKLFELVCMSEGGPVIVFCNYREAVDRMSKFLSDKGVSNIGYHGAMEQDKRDTALFKFRSGSVQVLVTTDIASRGFDIKDVETIIHYQLPQTQEIFIHRNGRTARMNASGNAILMIGQEEHLPPYLEQEVPLLALPTTIGAPATPQWVSLFIAAGKKEKINKVDIVGFLGHKGLLKKEEIGIIEVKDHHSFVAIAANKVRNALPLLKNERIKNQKVRIDIAR